MILVLLGTQKNNFDRLLDEVEKNIENGIIEEEVIAQIGNTNYHKDKITVIKFCSQEKIDELIEQANFVITHGGVGSIISSIKKDKKVIAVPRLKKYKEHVNDHQIQIVEAMSAKELIIGITDINELGNKIKEIDKFSPKKFKTNTDNMIKIISEYIENN